MALCTGAIVVVFIPPLFASFPYLTLAGFLFYQVIVFRYYFGRRRGDFEYKYKESEIETALNKKIIDKYGMINFLKFKLDNLNQIPNSQLHLLPKLLKEEEDLEIKFAAYLKLADVYSKDENFEKQKAVLKKSVQIKQNNIVANLKLAVLFEREGDGENAINHYSLALIDLEISSEQLKIFIKNQIERIRMSGPLKRPPLPGLRYVTW
jgi:tetratricopeptide (TPR) repeat protein